MTFYSTARYMYFREIFLPDRPSHARAKILFIFIVDTYFFSYYCSRQQIYFFFLILFKVVIFISISFWCCSHWSYVSMTIYFLFEQFFFFFICFRFTFKNIIYFFSSLVWYDWPRNWWHNYSFSSLSLNLNLLLCVSFFLLWLWKCKLSLIYLYKTSYSIEFIFLSLILDFISFHLNIFILCWRHHSEEVLYVTCFACFYFSCVSQY